MADLATHILNPANSTPTTSAPVTNRLPLIAGVEARIRSPHSRQVASRTGEGTIRLGHLQGVGTWILGPDLSTPPTPAALLVAAQRSVLAALQATKTAQQSLA